MSGADSPKFTLIGGGLGGALLAAYLGKLGHAVELFERRPDPASGTTVGGRSINLALSVRGIEALREVGLAEKVLESAVPMRGRMIHDRKGGLHFQPYDQDPQRCIYSVSRGGLNGVTLAAAQALPNVQVRFNCRCENVDLDAPSAEIHDGATNQTIRTQGDVLIGVDGAFSAVRRAMQRLDRFEYSQTYLPHGYKELTIPPKGISGFALEPHALHIWPRRSFMMIALPNHDGSFTCTLFYHFDGPQSFAALRTDGDVQRFFDEQFPDAVPLMPALLTDFFQNPTGSMVTVRCAPWQYAGKVALLGDAAHAVVPFYGQGANAAFEDCFVLHECIRELAPDWRGVLERYEARRRPHAQALADLALTNFIEMRDKTGSRVFREYKRFERTMHRRLPGWFTPLYTLVSFTRTPYADAVRRARVQDRVVLGAIGAALWLVLTLLVALLGGWSWRVGGLWSLLLLCAAGLGLRLWHDRGRAALRGIGVRDP